MADCQSYFGMGLEAAEQGLDFEDFAPRHPTHRQWYRAGWNAWPRVANQIEEARATREAAAVTREARVTS